MEKQKHFCEGDPELSMTRNCRVHCNIYLYIYIYNYVYVCSKTIFSPVVCPTAYARVPVWRPTCMSFSLCTVRRLTCMLYIQHMQDSGMTSYMYDVQSGARLSAWRLSCTPNNCNKISGRLTYLLFNLCMNMSMTSYL